MITGGAARPVRASGSPSARGALRRAVADTTVLRMEPDPNATSWDMARLDAARATRQYDAVLPWLDTAAPPASTPVAVEVWVYSADLSHILLVRHRWRG
jgi:hypothetical protein